MSIYHRKMTDKEFEGYKNELLKEHEKFGKYLKNELKEAKWNLKLDHITHNSIEAEKTVTLYSDIFDKWWLEEWEKKHG